MIPLTEKDIRACFVNATKREVSQATLPDLDSLDWENLDYLGWQDRKAPLSAYAIVVLDGTPTGILLRAAKPSSSTLRRKGVCAWCEDIVETNDVSLYAARRGGPLGRRGDTIGTLICTDFRCSRNVRRTPTRAEAGSDVESVREEIVARRVAGLRERSARFVEEVASTR